MSNRVEPIDSQYNQNNELILRVQPDVDNTSPPSYFETIQNTKPNNLIPSTNLVLQPERNVQREEVEAAHQLLLNNVINKYAISFEYSKRLHLLQIFKIVFIFDDSGSMNTRLTQSPLNTDFVKATRWDELKFYARIAIEVTNVFDREGVDVYFLNRPPAKCVKNMNDLEPYFLDPPSGFTPMTRVLRGVLAQPEYFFDKYLVVVIVTDGEPTNDR